MAEVFLGLGSNLGEREHILNEAVKRLGDEVGRVVQISSFYVSEPWGYKSENKYLNAVVLLETEMNPYEVLSATQKIEKSLGRQTKTTGQYADRTIDIDILFYNDFVLSSSGLEIPHPLLDKREFVLVPLSEIAPGFIHPVSGLTITALRDKLVDS